MPIPAPRYWRRKAMLAKLETVYGTDAVPTPGANAIEARNVSLTPLEMDAIEDDVIQTYLGNSPEIVTASRVKLAYDVALQGSGTAGTPPAIGPLLRGCGLAEVITVDVKVDYSPVSSGHEALSQYMYIDGVLHKLLGVRGNVSFGFTPKQLAKARFEWIGLFQTVADAALPTPTMTSWKKANPVTNSLTSGFSLHGFATALYDLNIGLGNQVIHRDDIVGLEDVQIPDRKPSGKVVIQAPKIADHDYFTASRNVTLDALALTHGTAAGYRVKVAAPKVQVKSPSYGERNGIATLEMDLRLNPSAGDDELVLTFD